MSQPQMLDFTGLEGIPKIKIVSFQELKKKRGSLRQYFWPVLAGYEKFGFSEEDIFWHIHDFDISLRDIVTCTRCNIKDCAGSLEKFPTRGDSWPYRNKPKNEDGKGRKERRRTRYSPNCKAFYGMGWYGLSRWACEMYERPHFAVHNCSGPTSRKQYLRETLISDPR